MIEKINLAEKLATFDEPWNPKIVAELNGQYVKVAHAEGEHVWHHHDEEDELFLIVSGRMRIGFRDGEIELGPGECCVVPRGVEHKPVALGQVELLLFEPASTRSTGNVNHVYTREADDLERI